MGLLVLLKTEGNAAWLLCSKTSLRQEELKPRLTLWRQTQIRPDSQPPFISSAARWKDGPSGAEMCKMHQGVKETSSRSRNGRDSWGRGQEVRTTVMGKQTEFGIYRHLRSVTPSEKTWGKSQLSQLALSFESWHLKIFQMTVNYFVRILSLAGKQLFAPSSAGFSTKP